jgi:hypothetical protein
MEKDVQMLVRSQDLEIPEMMLNIPYEKITQVRTEIQEATGKNPALQVVGIFLGILSLIFLGILLGLIIIAILLLFFLSSYSKNRMIIGYTDELQLEQIMWFEGDVSTLQNIIYKILLDTRQKKGST